MCEVWKEAKIGDEAFHLEGIALGKVSRWERKEQNKVEKMKEMLKKQQKSGSIVFEVTKK